MPQLGVTVSLFQTSHRKVCWTLNCLQEQGFLTVPGSHNHTRRGYGQKNNEQVVDYNKYEKISQRHIENSQKHGDDHTYRPMPSQLLVSQDDIHFLTCSCVIIVIKCWVSSSVMIHGSSSMTYLSLFLFSSQKSQNSSSSSAVVGE